MYDDDDEEWCRTFAAKGSALRVASKTNPRNLSCPTCKRRNMLTREDKIRGYQCDICADNTERTGGPFGY
jgi:hypothetical protein